MPRSSRHKSHKQSKHSSKEAKEYYSDSDEDVRMKEKERSGGKDEGGGSARVSKDSSYSASGEKRKLSSSSHLKEGKDGKDLSGNGNVDTLEEYVSSKRRKDKAEGGGGDRWNGGGDGKEDGGAESLKIDSEKGTKLKESKGFGDSKNKSSKRQESGGEKEDKNVGSLEKEESRSGSGRGESKRKLEKDSGRKEGKESREAKEKDRGSEREKKGQESKRDYEVRSVDTLLVKKQGSQWEDGVEERQGKKGRENTEVSIQDDFRNLELEKELEKRIRRRRDGSGDRDKGYDVRESDEKHVSSRGERSKDVRYKDEKYKDGFYGDKNQDEVEKDDRHRDVKYREDADKDIKYRDNGDRDNRYRDDKYHEDGEKDYRRREDKYREDGDRETRRKDDKYRDDGERDSRRRDDKYREDGERENKRRDDKYREDGDKNGRRSDEKHFEDAEKDDRYRDDKYREDSEKYKEDKRREDYERDIRHKDVKLGDDFDREKRLRDGKYKDEHASRDRSGDKSDVKRSRDEVNTTDHSLKSSTRDVTPPYDDRSRLKDDQGRKRKADKEDHGDIKSRSAKDQRYDAEKRSTSSARVETTSDRGRSASRNTDLEVVPSRSRHQGSPSSGSHVTREHYRLSKQDESKYREYAYEDRARHGVISTREYAGTGGVTDKVSSSRVVEKNVQKDDTHLLESSAERRLKTDARTSPRQLIDKSPSSISMDRRHVSRSDVRRSIDVEESGQRSGGSRDAKDYYGKEGRGNRDLPRDTLPGDDLSQTDGDNLSVSSPFVRTGNFSGSSKSHVPPPFRTGVDGPSNFGSSEDDHRMKFSNRHRRINDPNMARVQGSPWKGVPSWPSPIANGFMPFQHGPAPVGLHPVMPQFPPGPIFGVRPSMELNHHGVPYHIADAERFTGHGRPMGWRNPVDDSYPPPLHIWDANNAPFGKEPHVYGRPDWDHGRSLPGSRPWETSGDIWKGPKGDASMELQFPLEKENRYSNVPGDVTLAGQSVEPVQNDEIETYPPTDSNETRKSRDALEMKSPENTTITPAVALVPKKSEKEKSEKDNANLYHVYLSKLDISADLADPELYSKCVGLTDINQKINSDAEDARNWYAEELAEAKNPSSKSSSLVLGDINDPVFQKAMTLYKKQREEFVVISLESRLLSKLCIKTTEMKSDQEMLLSDIHKPELLLPNDKEQEAGGISPNSNEEVKPQLEDNSMEGNHESDEPVVADGLEKPEKTMVHVGTKEELSLTDLECREPVVISNSVPPKDVESSTVLATSVEEVAVPSNLMGDQLAGIGEERMLPDTKACEVVMAESNESGSVNLSRIHHHSPESTH